MKLWITKWIFSLCMYYLFQAKHSASGNTSWGIDGEKGALSDMEELGVWDPYAVKAQTYKTAMEVSLKYRHDWMYHKINVTLGYCCFFFFFLNRIS